MLLPDLEFLIIDDTSDMWKISVNFIFISCCCRWWRRHQIQIRQDIVSNVRDISHITSQILQIYEFAELDHKTKPNRTQNRNYKNQIRTEPKFPCLQRTRTVPNLTFGNPNRTEPQQWEFFSICIDALGLPTPTTAASSTCGCYSSQRVRGRCQVATGTIILSSMHTRSLGLWLRCCYSTGVAIRGLRVYPYPRVYPTRPVPAGTGRVRYMLHGYGLGRVDALRVRVYPFLSVKNNKMCIATLQVVVKMRHTWLDCLLRVYYL